MEILRRDPKACTSEFPLAGGLILYCREKPGHHGNHISMLGDYEWDDNGTALRYPQMGGQVVAAATEPDQRETFHTGAHRSSTTAGAANPTDYSQLSHVALRLMAETQAEGNAKYGYGNWQRGIPLSNLLSHALAHIFAIINGDVSENHFGHALWNLEKAAHFVETRPDLIDIEPLRKALNPPKMPELVRFMEDDDLSDMIAKVCNEMKFASPGSPSEERTNRDMDMLHQRLFGTLRGKVRHGR